MGYGEIQGGGPAGRYTLSLDYGEASRLANIAALESQAAKLDTDIAAAYVRLQAAEAIVAEARLAVKAASQAYIDGGGTGNESPLSMQAALVFLEQQRKAAIDAEKTAVDARLKYSALKVARSQVSDMLARWNAAVVIETKPVWCVDYTEDGTGEVGTIDINGETDITLIAPGCRQWRAGDGKVSTETKNAAIAKITAKQGQLSKRITDLNTQIDAETAKESILKAELDYAHIAYNTAPPELKQARANDVSIAAEKFQAQIAVVRRLKSRKVQTQSLQVEEARKLDAWNAKEASDSPVYGDGAMRHAITMSPEQSFLNRAIMPGWQRFMPTYRWGTITALDKDADTCSVSLASATSSQQSLNINQVSSLSNIPVVYMNCNAKAFEEGDEVVIEFESQDWSKPRVIGFLSGPKPCLQYTASYYVIGNINNNIGNQYLLAGIERFKDEAWGTFTSISPPANHKFLGWSDGVGTLFRNDGLATANISRTAQYTYAPNFKLSYGWMVEAYAVSEVYFNGTLFVRDWEVAAYGDFQWSADQIFGPVCNTPASGTFDQVIWSGQALSGANGDDVLYNLTTEWVGQTSSTGPIYLPNFPAGTSQTVTFKFLGSENVYTVSGATASNPFPGAVVPATGTSPAGSSTTVVFTATSWSASYG